MSKMLLPLLATVLISGCATPPASSVNSSEVIGADIELPAVAPAARVVTKPATPASSRKVWTIDEVTDWYRNYVAKEKGDSVGLQYQGSDAIYHFFAARVPSTRDWVKTAISKTDLRLDKELPDKSTVEPVRGYGFVDPYKGFRFLPRTATP